MVGHGHFGNFCEIREIFWQKLKILALACMVSDVNYTFNILLKNVEEAVN